MSNQQNILSILLTSLKVKHTRSYATKLFEEHPHKYNLYGLSDLLATYGVENMGLRMEEKSQLTELEAPFVAHFGSDFVVVTRVNPDKITYYWKEKRIDLSKEEFEQGWTGVVLLAETNEQSGEPEYRAHRKEEFFSSLFTLLFIGSVVGLFSLAYIVSELWTNLWGSLFFGLNIIGVTIGYLLLQKQLKVKGSYADKVCSLFSKSDCNNVLESDASLLFGIIHWSEIGLGYFIANTLLMLLFPWAISYLAWINLCALPYSLWSIWYQRYRAKQWCPLCLLTMGLFWSLFIVSLGGGLLTVSTIDWIHACWLGLMFILPITAIHLLQKPFSEYRRLSQITYELNHIKANEVVFQALLQNQSRYEVSQSDSQILFGNRESPVLITALTNPHCNPCAKMHKRIEAFMDRGGNRYCLQYIYSSFNDSMDDSNKALIAAYQQYPVEQVSAIYDEWFDGGKQHKELFFEKYNLSSTVDTETEFLRHEVWKQRTQLRATPTILINGHVLPENYKIEDLLMIELPFETR